MKCMEITCFPQFMQRLLRRYQIYITSPRKGRKFTNRHATVLLPEKKNLISGRHRISASIFCAAQNVVDEIIISDVDVEQCGNYSRMQVVAYNEWWWWVPRAVILAEIVDVWRFDNAKAPNSLAGYDVSPYQSGLFESRNSHISQYGSFALRKPCFVVMKNSKPLKH